MFAAEGDELCQSDLRCARAHREHRFAKEDAAEAGAVEPAGKSAVDPGLDALHAGFAAPGAIGRDLFGDDPDARSPPRGAVARAVTTRRKALSMRTSQPGVVTKRRSVLRNERASLNSAGSSTVRGSGDHQRMDRSSLYQEKMPFA